MTEGSPKDEEEHYGSILLSTYLILRIDIVALNCEIGGQADYYFNSFYLPRLKYKYRLGFDIVQTHGL